MAEISDLKLAAIVAVATAVGAISVPFVSKLLPSVDVTNQSSVQLIEIAVNVLAVSKPQGAESFAPDAIALRKWSVDTINAAAGSVKIDGAARDSLINGRTVLPLSLSSMSLGEVETLPGAPWDRNRNKGGISPRAIEELRETLQKKADTEQDPQ